MNNLYLCYSCQTNTVFDGTAYCLVCGPWIQERKGWKERVFKRDQIIKDLEQKLANCSCQKEEKKGGPM